MSPTIAAEQAGDVPLNKLSGTELIEALQAGGYVIYFRHGKTVHETFDHDRVNLADCSKQRMLSEEGRQEMRDIGEAIRSMNIPVSTILASPYCRARDTAKLAFGRVQMLDDLKHTVVADEKTAARQAIALRKLLEMIPENGTNSVLAGHTGNLQEATGIWPDPEGVAIIFKPTGSSFEFIARVPPEQWAMLAAEMKAK